MHLWILAVQLLLPVTAHEPQPAIPHFDIVAECDRAIGLPGCVEREHAALGALTFWWGRVRDDRVKSVCIADVEKIPILRYNQLMGCLAARAHLPQPSLADMPRSTRTALRHERFTGDPTVAI